MNILFIGDIVGRSGREALETNLSALRNEFSADVVIVNADNASNGKGVNVKHARAFLDSGVDILTTGDHVWDQREMIGHIGSEPRILRAVNFPKGTNGNGFLVYQAVNGQKILVIHAIGRVFMKPMNDPFEAIQSVLQKYRLGHTIDAIFVDFHAEATSEKVALGHHLDGKVSAVIGTHTHIPTADAHILGGGTAYMTDAGMSGDYDSVIGAQKHAPIQKFITGLPGAKLEPAKGSATLCGVCVTTNAKGLAKTITPFKRGGVLSDI